MFPILDESILLIFIFPFVATAAARYVPASILSKGIENLPPDNSSTPSTIISSVPAPSIFAPRIFKKFAKSIISGSLATFFSLVVPSASVAAIIKFSVPVTVMPSNLRLVPINLLHDA